MYDHNLINRTKYERACNLQIAIYLLVDPNKIHIFGDFCVDGNLTLLLDSTMFNANDKQIYIITVLIRDQSQWLSDSGHVIII